MLTTDLTDLRQREFARLDANGVVYLDYTGSALYPDSLVRGDAVRLADAVLGNPHSLHSPSLASMDAIETARLATLHFFDADPEIYEVIFTANATAAIRILAEAFRFGPGSHLLLTDDNHNSVNGLWIPALRCGTCVDHVPLDAELRVRDLRSRLRPTAPASLFAFPAQSNFSGVQHPLEWITDAQQQGYRVLLDAASFAPTNPLSLSSAPADFVAVSFYKMFGYPTGVGALIARRDALDILDRDYFGGGTVQSVSVQNRTVLRKNGAEGYEDGTANFLAMPAIVDGLRWLTDLDLRRVKQHVAELTAELLDRLAEMGNGVEVYGPLSTAARGATTAFNVRRNGRLLDHENVAASARQHGIAIRDGCFCNPGTAVRAFANSAPDSPTGALRASLGIPTTSSDIDRLVEFVRELLRD